MANPVTDHILDTLSAVDDHALDLAMAALALADTARPGRCFESYVTHLGILVAEALREAGRASMPEGARRRGEILRSVLVDRWHYHGDVETYEDLDNADLMQVIDRRKGLPVTLGILYLHVARKLGWDADGLAFPGHFLIRVCGDAGDRVIMDPFHDGVEISPADLRALYKSVKGQGAELAPEAYAPVTNREILLRLQGNIRLRALQEGDYPTALAAVQRMLLIAPSDFRLWREGGLMHMRLGDLDSALTALERYLGIAPPGPDRDSIARVMEELRQGRS